MKIYPFVDIEEGIKDYGGSSNLNMTNELLRKMAVNGTISFQCPEGSRRNPQHMMDYLVHEVKYGAINYMIVPDHPRHWYFNTSWKPPMTKLSQSGMLLQEMFFFFKSGVKYVLHCWCRWKCSQFKSIKKVREQC